MTHTYHKEINDIYPNQNYNKQKTFQNNEHGNKIKTKEIQDRRAPENARPCQASDRLYDPGSRSRDTGLPRSAVHPYSGRICDPQRSGAGRSLYCHPDLDPAPCAGPRQGSTALY